MLYICFLPFFLSLPIKLTFWAIKKNYTSLNKIGSLNSFPTVSVNLGSVSLLLLELLFNWKCIMICCTHLKKWHYNEQNRAKLNCATSTGTGSVSSNGDDSHSSDNFLVWFALSSPCCHIDAQNVSILLRRCRCELTPSPTPRRILSN